MKKFANFFKGVQISKGKLTNIIVDEDSMTGFITTKDGQLHIMDLANVSP